MKCNLEDADYCTQEHTVYIGVSLFVLALEFSLASKYTALGKILYQFIYIIIGYSLQVSHARFHHVTAIEFLI